MKDLKTNRKETIANDIKQSLSSLNLSILEARNIGLEVKFQDNSYSLGLTKSPIEVEIFEKIKY